ncbi:MULTISPECIES: LacI family DNA-binding transcriptional regulator [unclassified Microbacterium]|uniref:LacI family DNA-binding transcriptional regulator n=1 Tax=unclassified Microbacterium TaxID=2609290 RepID=UPI00214CB36A|nr:MULTISPECIES: LacI family DNA-binding transcriptional regulator [unclassified Microbacterium]MCR2783402.1 LacI family transcriptional regulator [Microbacterium sp. zg.B96]WIM15729.1 LacI family DNA-binding transcriptional regulator [Microbacterium sp. zg-B96]
MNSRVSPESDAPPKLRDVARHAGVSMGTVSHVLNHPDKVSAKTLERVRASIEALGFVRDANASSLAAGGSRSIGLVVIDLANSMFVDVALGAQQTARARGLNLLLAGSQDDFQLQAANVDFFDEARVAGLLLAPMRDSSAQIQKLRKRGCPVVLVNYDPGPGDDCCVVVDNEQVGFLAGRHLIEEGCDRLLFVGGTDPSLQPVALRREGLRRAVRETQGRVRFEELHAADLTEASGVAAAARIAARGPDTRPNGVVAVTDTLAAGFITEMTRQGIDVPREMAVMGCDHNTTASVAAVSLTTVAMQGERLGLAAMSLLLEEIADPAGHLHQRVVVEPQLVRRGSTTGHRPRVSIAAAE